MTWQPERLKTLRERRHLTQDALAQRVGVHRVTIARLETGARQPGLEMLEGLAKALQVKVTDLLT